MADSTEQDTYAAVCKHFGGEAAYLAWRKLTLERFPPPSPELRADLVTLLTHDENEPQA